MIKIRNEKSNYNAHLKKHYCPNCCEPLKTLTVGNIINTQSCNSANATFPFSGSNMFGTMTSYSTQFQCPKCMIRYKSEDLKKTEQNNNKMKER